VVQYIHFAVTWPCHDNSHIYTAVTKTCCNPHTIMPTVKSVSHMVMPPTDLHSRSARLQVAGFPKVMGVLTHLDTFKDPKQLKKAKKALKQRFWTEVYDGAKVR
jgi:hypothetical protein